MTRVAIQPKMLQWARERARLAQENLLKSFPKLPQWESGELQPTFRQLEKFARATHVPFGYLFLSEPPVEPIPIPDFRTLTTFDPKTISPDLRDTIYTMQYRQAWLRDERLEQGAEPLPFVGSASLSDDPLVIGQEMRRILALDDNWAAGARTWQEALSWLRQGIEALGVMAVINGVVGNNTRRVLDVTEFRGFALVDELAPLIFVNGADAKSAQMFTLAHELAHVWLGKVGEGISGFDQLLPDGHAVEDFCNQAAAEFLVPAASLQAVWPQVKKEDQPFQILAKTFKVSPIVVGRRALDLRLVDRQSFFNFYNQYTQQERKQKQRGTGGGDFYRNQNVRVGKLFFIQVARAAREGRIGYKQAYDLTGLRGKSFHNYTQQVIGAGL